MEGYEHVQRVRSRGLKTADLSYQGGRPNIRPTDKLKRPPSRLSNPIECASRQQVLRERTGGCSPDEYANSYVGGQQWPRPPVAELESFVSAQDRTGSTCTASALFKRVRSSQHCRRYKRITPQRFAPQAGQMTLELWASPPPLTMWNFSTLTRA